MRKQNYLLPFILIGAGLYFLLKQFSIPFLDGVMTWPTLLVILGISLFIHSYLSREYDKLFPSVVLLGLGIHFHAVALYPNWVEHWSVYAIIIGVAFLVRYQKSKAGLYPGLIILFVGLFMLVSITNNQFSQTMDSLIQIVEDYWPVGLIGFGVYLLFKKK